MITREKVELWLRHRAYPDIVDRGSPAERTVMTSDDWAEIEELVARLKLAARTLTSPEFDEATESELRARTEDERVAVLLKWVATSGQGTVAAVGESPRMYGVSVPFLLVAVVVAGGSAYLSTRASGSIVVGVVVGVLAMVVLVAGSFILVKRSRGVG